VKESNMAEDSIINDREKQHLLCSFQYEDGVLSEVRCFIHPKSGSLTVRWWEKEHNKGGWNVDNISMIPKEGIRKLIQFLSQYGWPSGF